MKLLFVNSIRDKVVVCGGNSRREYLIPRKEISFEIAVDMPILMDEEKHVYPYHGAFKDHDDGKYKHIQWKNGRLTLCVRRLPLTRKELIAFIEELVETNDSDLSPLLELIIDDLLQSGKTDLAFALINRTELVDNYVVQSAISRLNERVDDIQHRYANAGNK